VDEPAIQALFLSILFSLTKKGNKIPERKSFKNLITTFLFYHKRLFFINREKIPATILLFLSLFYNKCCTIKFPSA